ncbi:ABC transporter permease subunit [Alkalihalobacillus sp. FSL R5-0424]
MLRLVKSELYKLRLSKYTWIIGGSLLIISLFYAIILSFNSTDVENANWREQIQNQIQSDQETIATLHPVVPMYSFLKEQIAINQYRLEVDLPPNTEFNVWTLLIEIGPIISIIGLISIIHAATSVSSEFTRGTIKIISTSSNKRWKILTSKFFTLMILLTTLLFSVVALNTLIGYIFLGTDGGNYYLTYQNGEVQELGVVKYLLLNFSGAWFNILLIASLAFMISALFRNNVIAIGFSLLIYFTGTAITNFLALHSDWVKFTLLANSDLTQYLDGSTTIASMSIEFSVVVNLIYLVIFLLISLISFTKRDIKTA